jgi:CubicO group peptidase (beta-lactamase class C family)
VTDGGNIDGSTPDRGVTDSTVDGEDTPDLGVTDSTVDGEDAPDLGATDSTVGDDGAPDLGPGLGSRLSFAAAAAYSKRHKGGAVLVQIGDQIVFEEYQNGATARTSFHLHSATKGFWAAACAAALEDGLLTGLDQQADSLITEWKDSARHPRKSMIKLRHLLELTSGLSQDVQQIQGLDPAAQNIFTYVVDELRMPIGPGKSFQYGPSHFYVFGVLLSRALQEAGRDPDPLLYLKQRVLDPVGIVATDWARDRAGNPHIPNGAYLTARNWIRYGRFLLDDGRVSGKQIVSASLLQTMREPGAVNPGHGRFLWLNTTGGQGNTPTTTAPPGSTGGFIYHDGHPDLFAALGAGKNRMYMFPALDMVVVRQTEHERDGFIDHVFLATLLTPPAS